MQNITPEERIKQLKSFALIEIKTIVFEDGHEEEARQKTRIMEVISGRNICGRAVHSGSMIVGPHCTGGAVIMGIDHHTQGVLVKYPTGDIHLMDPSWIFDKVKVLSFDQPLGIDLNDDMHTFFIEKMVNEQQIILLKGYFELDKDPNRLDPIRKKSKDNRR